MATTASTLILEEWVDQLREMLKDIVPSTVADEEAALTAHTIRFGTDFLKRCVNKGVRAYTKRRPQQLRGTLSVSDGTRRYASSLVATDVVKVKEIIYVSPSNVSDERDLRFEIELDGMIFFYAVGDAFGLPENPASLTVYYTAPHDTMVEGGTTTVPAEDEEAVLHWAAKLALEHEAADLGRKGSWKRGRVSQDDTKGADASTKTAAWHGEQFQKITSVPAVVHSRGRPEGGKKEHLTDPTAAVDRYGYRTTK